jgi:hypothetical protein
MKFRADADPARFIDLRRFYEASSGMHGRSTSPQSSLYAFGCCAIAARLHSQTPLYAWM